MNPSLNLIQDLEFTETADCATAVVGGLLSEKQFTGTGVWLHPLPQPVLLSHAPLLRNLPTSVLLQLQHLPRTTVEMHAPPVKGTH
jgi:hypothetical protein